MPEGVNHEEVEEEEDPLMQPNNFDAVKNKLHHKASRVNYVIDGNKEFDPKDLCECCNQPTGDAVSYFKMCAPTRAFENLGSGFPLFFSMKKHMILIFFVLFLIPGLVGLGTNYNQNNQKEWTADTPVFVYGTLGAWGKGEEKYNKDWVTGQSLVHHAAIVCILIYSVIL